MRAEGKIARDARLAREASQEVQDVVVATSTEEKQNREVSYGSIEPEKTSDAEAKKDEKTDEEPTSAGNSWWLVPFVGQLDVAEVWESFFVSCEQVGKDGLTRGTITLDDLTSFNKRICVGMPALVVYKALCRRPGGQG